MQTIKVKRPVLSPARGASQNFKFGGESSLFSILKPVRGGSVSVNNESQMSIGKGSHDDRYSRNSAELTRLYAKNQNSEGGK